MKKQAFNPFLPSYEYIPDGEPRVFGNRVYVYGSHDAFDGSYYCQNDYVCWSAPVDDLGNWKFEGTIYKYTQDPIHKNADDHLLQAPDAIQGPDGRYYLYYSMASTDIISVAVCDSPAGQYEFYGHVHYEDGTVLGKKDTDLLQFDPGIYVEDNRVYLYSGFCPPNTFMWEMQGKKAPAFKGAMVIELYPDMITVKKAPEIIAPYVKNSSGTGYEGHEFFEAPSMRKRGDKYYFIYSSINGHELCYAMSDYPDKGFAYCGTIVSNADIGLEGRTSQDAINYYGNNHGSIVEILGQWYIFYHRHTNRNQFSRQACAEKIYFDEYGKIPQVEITSCGLNPSCLAGRGLYEARIACRLWGKNGATLYGLGDRPIDKTNPYFTQDGEDREDNPDQHISSMNDGSVAGFKYFDLENLSQITVKIRGSAEGTLTVSDELSGNIIAEIPVHPSDDWGKYCAAAHADNGKTALYFTYHGIGAFDFMDFELV